MAIASKSFITRATVRHLSESEYHYLLATATLSGFEIVPNQIVNGEGKIEKWTRPFIQATLASGALKLATYHFYYFIKDEDEPNTHFTYGGLLPKSHVEGCLHHHINNNIACLDEVDIPESLKSQYQKLLHEWWDWNHDTSST